MLAVYFVSEESAAYCGAFCCLLYHLSVLPFSDEILVLPHNHHNALDQAAVPSQILFLRHAMPIFVKRKEKVKEIVFVSKL